MDCQSTLLFDKIREIAGGRQFAGKFPGLNFVGAYPRYPTVVMTSFDYGCWSFDWTTRSSGEARVLGEGEAETPFIRAGGIFFTT